MAGLGQRFVDVGYKNPKPFIWVDDDYIISKVVNMFDEEDEIIFICNNLNSDSLSSETQRLLLSLLRTANRPLRYLALPL